MAAAHLQLVLLCCAVGSSAEIHADAPPFVEMSIEQEILETGLKVVDLLAPYAKGGKIGMLHCYVTKDRSLSLMSYSS